MEYSDYQVHLAGPPELTTVCGLPALAKLVGRGLSLRVTLDRPAERLLAGLAAGAFDTVISTIAPEEEAVTATPLFEEEYVLVASPEVGERIDLDRLPDDCTVLAEVPLIAYADDLPLIRRYWRAVFGTTPADRPAAVVPDLRGVLALAVAGGGFTVLPRYLCRGELASGQLIGLLDPSPPPAITVYLATGPGSTGSGVRSVNQCLLDHARHW